MLASFCSSTFTLFDNEFRLVTIAEIGETFLVCSKLFDGDRADRGLGFGPWAFLGRGVRREPQDP